MKKKEPYKVCDVFCSEDYESALNYFYSKKYVLVDSTIFSNDFFRHERLVFIQKDILNKANKTALGGADLCNQKRKK